MIVEHKINYFKALQVTGKKFIVLTLLSILISRLVYRNHWQDELIPDKFIVLMSSAIVIFLGFRINAAYSRWRDGYGVFRDLTTTCLSLLAQITLLTKTQTEQNLDLNNFKRDIAYYLLQYVHCVRLELIEKVPTDWPNTLNKLTFNKEPLFSEQDIGILVTKKRKGSYILSHISEKIHQKNSSGTLTFITTGELAKSIQLLYVLEQSMVYLKQTPFPWGYQFYTRMFVWILPFLFMFSTFNQINIVVNMVISFIATIFITTEQVARNLDNPITSPFNGIPFNANCRMLEIELLECLDIQHDLTLIEAKDGVLL
jgi:ion channel-forming bestrophin family protein